MGPVTRPELERAPGARQHRVDLLGGHCQPQQQLLLGHAAAKRWRAPSSVIGRRSRSLPTPGRESARSATSGSTAAGGSCRTAPVDGFPRASSAWLGPCRPAAGACSRPRRTPGVDGNIGIVAHVAVSNLAYAHPGGDLLFSDVSFRVSPGQHVGFVGTNGVGKSTLLKILVGELAPDEGEYAVGGRGGLHAAGRWRERRRADGAGRSCCRWRRGRCGRPGESMLALEAAARGGRSVGGDEAGRGDRRLVCAGRL